MKRPPDRRPVQFTYEQHLFLMFYVSDEYEALKAVRPQSIKGKKKLALLRDLQRKFWRA